MQLFPLLVTDLFQRVVQAGKGLENSPCLWDRAGNSAAVRSPWRCCGSSSDEVSVWQSHSDRPGLNRRKKISTSRNILFYFWRYYLVVKRLFGAVYQHTGSTSNSTMLPCRVPYYILLPYYSAANTECDSGFAMLLTLLPVHVMLWCPVALIRWTNVGTSQDTSSSLVLHCQQAETKEDLPFLNLTLMLQALSHGLHLRAGGVVSWGMGSDL